jgi:1,4-dihydroxy-2-naphthoate octaprenyltransferase
VAALGYVGRRRAWVLLVFAALLGAVFCVFDGGLLVHLWHHIGLLLLLPAPMALIAWLAVQAHDAQALQPCQTCRRQ